MSRQQPPARIVVERFVKTIVGSFATPVVDPSTLHETSEVLSIIGGQRIPPEFTAALRGFVKHHGGSSLTTAEVRQALTIREIVEIILGKWS